MSKEAAAAAMKELARKPKEDGVWMDSLLKATSACDRFFNCAYVKRQLEDEWAQEIQSRNGAVDRVWKRLEKGVEVEVYRQFLFDENEVAASVDGSTPHPDEDQNGSRYGKARHYRNDDDDSIPELQRTDS